MRAAWLVVTGFSLAALLLGGCGGHDGQVPPGPGPGPQGATFVGKAVCIVCHGDIGKAFAKSAHGKNFHDPSSNGAHADLISGMGGACAPCHTTGFGATSGWTSSAATPQLDNIGCECCHGAGSKHAGAPSKNNISKLPTAEKTCWTCHVPSYKFLANGAPPNTTAATLAGTAPGKIALHYRQTPYLLGYLAYNRNQINGPHAYIDNTCVTCHLNPKSKDHHGATALEVDYLACAACHGSAADAQALFEGFESEINAELVTIGGADPSSPGDPDPNGAGGLLGAYATAHNIDLTNNSNPADPAVQAYKGAKYDYLYVLGGGIAHNPPMTDQLVTDMKNLLK